MKRYTLTALLILIMALGVFSDARAGKTLKQMSTIDAVTVATSDEIDTTTAIKIADYDYIAFGVEIDWASGGSNGTGYVKIQGRLKEGSGIWVDLLVVDPADSFEIKANVNWGTSLAADHSIAGIVSFFPTTAAWDDDDVSLGMIGGTLANALPYQEIRAIIFDDSWDAVATFTGYWILGKD